MCSLIPDLPRSLEVGWIFLALSGYVSCLRYIGWNTCINSVVASDEVVDLALFHQEPGCQVKVFA